MALTVEQIHRRDQHRRALAVPPDPTPAPPVSATPVGVYAQATRPTDVAVGSVWIPLNSDGTPKSLDNWQVFA